MPAAANLTPTGTKNMKLFLALLFCAPLTLSTLVRADNQGLDAAIGGAVGGINGALPGGASGAATEVVVATGGHRNRPGRGPYYASPPTSRPHYKAPSHQELCRSDQKKDGHC